MKTPILDVNDLTIEFKTESGVVRAVENLSFTLEPGETLGIVGESGSGKSTTSLSVMGLLPKSARVTGEIHFQLSSSEGSSVNLLTLLPSALVRYRGSQISMVFQQPLTSLNPVHKCGSQVIEAIRLHEESVSYKEAYRRTLALFDEVRLPDPKAMMSRYPHELSGGQIQRVMIAMALALNPALLIADEPTTALDVTIQATILQMLREIRDRRGMAILFITHDLGVIAEIADSVAVMYQGKLVEYGSAAQILTNPQHPYTKGLLACRPTLEHRLQYLPTVADFMEVRRSPTGQPVLHEKTFAATPQMEVTASESTQRLEELQLKPPLLSVQNLCVFFPMRGLFGRTTSYVRAVNDISFEVYPGETLGLVGESGCGKSTLGRALLRLIEPTSGRVFFESQEVTRLPSEQLRHLRREMQMIFQDPFSSLDSRMSIGSSVMEPLRIHAPKLSDKQRRERVAELLERVSLSPDFMHRYPHELSGGQRQRVCIARSLALNPKFIICDESVSALDVSVQAQVLNLLRELQKELLLTYIFISHDLSVVRFLSDRIMVMNQGKIEEIGAAESVLRMPSSDYTRQMIQATPKLRGSRE